MFQTVPPSMKIPRLGHMCGGNTKGIELDETAAWGKSMNSVFFWSNIVYIPVSALTAANLTTVFEPSGSMIMSDTVRIDMQHFRDVFLVWGVVENAEFVHNKRMEIERIEYVMALETGGSASSGDGQGAGASSLHEKPAEEDPEIEEHAEAAPAGEVPEARGVRLVDMPDPAVVEQHCLTHLPMQV